MTKCVDVRGRLVVFEPTNFVAPYQALFDQTDVSMNEQWSAYQYNNFDNEFARANKALSDRESWWYAISRDKIVDSRSVGGSKIEVTYVSHAGMPSERVHKVVAPVNGWYVPNEDCMPKNGLWRPFYPDTGIPFETLQNRDETIVRLEKAGIPKEQVSHFHRTNNYHDAERLVGRDFDPECGYGRFDVVAYGLPSDSGCDRVASFPAHSVPEIVFKID